jgi:hypothetical protein
MPPKKHVHYVLMSLLLFAVLLAPSFYLNPSSENYKAKELYEDGLVLKSILPQDAVLGAFYSPQIAYSSKMKTYTVKGDICGQLACPVYPFGMHKIYGCERVDFFVTDKITDRVCIRLVHVNESKNFYVYENIQKY